MKVCLVGSSGGHLTHLYMLKPFWKDKEHFWVTFDKKDARSLLEGEKMYPCYYPTNRSLKKKLMSELTAPLKIYPQVLENIRVTDKKAAQNDPAVQEAVSRVAEALGDTGRILVRESGTEPVVRVMVEAPDHDTCQKYVDEVVNVICEKGYKA